MSLASPYQEHYYVADGVTTSFSFGEYFTGLSQAYVKSIIYFDDGTNCVPTFTVDMTTGFITIVTLTKPDGTVLTVPPAGSIVRVFRDTPEQQNVTASQLQNYTAKQLERIFDSVVAMIQEVSYSDLHKTIRLTETQRDVSMEQLKEENDQAILYWDFETRQLKATDYGQNQVVKSDTVDRLVYLQPEGKIYFIPKGSNNPIAIGSATIHNDLGGRNAPDCHPESAITGLTAHLQELRDADTALAEDVQTALNRSQEAKDTADAAKETAEYAQTIAGQAKDIAEDAKETAEGIEGIAQEAKDTADEAKEIAQDAKDIAEGVVEDIEAVEEGLANHIADKANPHEVTKAQVGLSNVDNTSDLNKPISTATQTALDLKADKSTTYTKTETDTLLGAKQDIISDLSTIRSNAQAGKSASDTIATYGNIVTHDVAEFATAAQGALADSALQPGDNISELVNDVGYLTQHQTLADLGITATASEINVLDGITATTTELNYTDGVTSNIQTQLNAKAADTDVVHKTGNETISGTKTFNETLQLKSNLSFRSYGSSDSGRLQFRAQPSDNVIRGTVAITDGYSTAGSGYNGFVAQMVARAGSTTSDPFNTIRVSNKGVEYIQEANDGTITGQYIIVDNYGLIPSARLAASGSVGQVLTKTTTGQDWETLATVATTGSYSDLSGTPTIGNATLTIQKNSVAVDTFTANATVDKSINITVPVSAADVNALPDSTKYVANASMTINNTTYVVTLQLKDQDNNNIGTAQTIDLPLESVVVSGSYDSATKEVVLTLQNGSTIRFSVADLVSGLQTEITSNNMLDADLVDDSTSTNKFVTSSDITNWNGKADKTNRVNGAPLSNATSKFYGTSDTAAATVQKEVSIPSITSLDEGTFIIVQPTVTSTVANSTLKLNNFDAYPMLYNNAAITTSTDSIVWNANYPSIFVFNGTYWVFAGHGLDSNTTYTLNYTVDAGQYKAGTGNYAVTRYSILAQKANGTWEKITATNASHSVATSKSVNTNGFILNQLRYYGTTTVVANGALIATNTLYEKSASVDMRYSTNCGGTTTWALGDYIYLVGTIGADGLFYLDTTTWWSNALPTTNDGKLYIRLGLSLTAAGYTMSFFDDRPIFYHDGTGIKEYKVADNKQDVISDLATIRSGAAAGATAVQPGDLATVATSGSYNDLSDKPTIPAAQVNSDWNAVSGVAQILNKPTLATVATSGSYNDLSNKPTIPAVNNPTITITQGGVTKGSFSLNQATGDTIALDAGGGGIGNIDNLTITANADDEIQAVAVIDQNTGIAKTWTGTMAEYDAIVTKDPETEYIITDDIGGSATEIGQITEALNNKVDKGHQVVEFQQPTSANNYTWYRKYADGWVEQGGKYLNRAASGSNTVTLLVTMADTNYCLITQRIKPTTSAETGNEITPRLYNVTTTSFGADLRVSNGNTSTTVSDWCWQVSGMAA